MELKVTLTGDVEAFFQYMSSHDPDNYTYELIIAEALQLLFEKKWLEETDCGKGLRKAIPLPKTLRLGKVTK